MMKQSREQGLAPRWWASTRSRCGVRPAGWCGHQRRADVVPAQGRGRSEERRAGEEVPRRQVRPGRATRCSATPRSRCGPMPPTRRSRPTPRPSPRRCAPAPTIPPSARSTYDAEGRHQGPGLRHLCLEGRQVVAHVDVGKYLHRNGLRYPRVLTGLLSSTIKVLWPVTYDFGGMVACLPRIWYSGTLEVEGNQSSRWPRPPSPSRRIMPAST